MGTKLLLLATLGGLLAEALPATAPTASAGSGMGEGKFWLLVALMVALIVVTLLKQQGQGPSLEATRDALRKEFDAKLGTVHKRIDTLHGETHQDLTNLHTELRQVHIDATKAAFGKRGAALLVAWAMALGLGGAAMAAETEVKNLRYKVAETEVKNLRYKMAATEVKNLWYSVAFQPGLKAEFKASAKVAMQAWESVCGVDFVTVAWSKKSARTLLVQMSREKRFHSDWWVDGWLLNCHPDTTNPRHIGQLMLHEFGHALGLSHSDNKADIMAPVVVATAITPEAAKRAQKRWGKPAKKKLTLFNTDEHGPLPRSGQVAHSGGEGRRVLSRRLKTSGTVDCLVMGWVSRESRCGGFECIRPHKPWGAALGSAIHGHAVSFAFFA